MQSCAAIMTVNAAASRRGEIRSRSGSSHSSAPNSGISAATLVIGDPSAALAPTARA